MRYRPNRPAAPTTRKYDIMKGRAEARAAAAAAAATTTAAGTAAAAAAAAAASTTAAAAAAAAAIPVHNTQLVGCRVAATWPTGAPGMAHVGVIEDFDADAGTYRIRYEDFNGTRGELRILHYRIMVGGGETKLHAEDPYGTGGFHRFTITEWPATIAVRFAQRKAAATAAAAVSAAASAPAAAPAAAPLVGPPSVKDEPRNSAETNSQLLAFLDDDNPGDKHRDEQGEPWRGSQRPVPPPLPVPPSTPPVSLGEFPAPPPSWNHRDELNATWDDFGTLASGLPPDTTLVTAAAAAATDEASATTNENSSWNPPPAPSARPATALAAHGGATAKVEVTDDDALSAAAGPEAAAGLRRAAGATADGATADGVKATTTALATTTTDAIDNTTTAAAAAAAPSVAASTPPAHLEQLSRLTLSTPSVQAMLDGFVAGWLLPLLQNRGNHKIAVHELELQPQYVEFTTRLTALLGKKGSSMSQVFSSQPFTRRGIVTSKSGALKIIELLVQQERRTEPSFPASGWQEDASAAVARKIQPSFPAEEQATVFKRTKSSTKKQRARLLQQLAQIKHDVAAQKLQPTSPAEEQPRSDAYAHDVSAAAELAQIKHDVAAQKLQPTSPAEEQLRSDAYAHDVSAAAELAQIPHDVAAQKLQPTSPAEEQLRSDAYAHDVSAADEQQLQRNAYKHIANTLKRKVFRRWAPVQVLQEYMFKPARVLRLSPAAAACVKYLKDVGGISHFAQIMIAQSTQLLDRPGLTLAKTLHLLRRGATPQGFELLIARGDVTEYDLSYTLCWRSATLRNVGDSTCKMLWTQMETNVATVRSALMRAAATKASAAPNKEPSGETKTPTAAQTSKASAVTRSREAVLNSFAAWFLYLLTHCRQYRIEAVNIGKTKLVPNKYTDFKAKLKQLGMRPKLLKLKVLIPSSEPFVRRGIRILGEGAHLIITLSPERIQQLRLNASKMAAKKPKARTQPKATNRGYYQPKATKKRPAAAAPAAPAAPAAAVVDDSNHPTYNDLVVSSSSEDEDDEDTDEQEHEHEGDAAAVADGEDNTKAHQENAGEGSGGAADGEDVNGPKSAERRFEDAVASHFSLRGRKQALLASARSRALNTSVILEQDRDHCPESALLGWMDTHGTGRLEDCNEKVFLNMHRPFALCVCGVQGAGKSHTLSVVLENCLIPFPQSDLVRLRTPMAALMFHYDQSVSNICEATGIVHLNSKFTKIIKQAQARAQQPPAANEGEDGSDGGVGGGGGGGGDVGGGGGNAAAAGDAATAADPATARPPSVWSPTLPKVIVLVSPTFYKQRRQFYLGRGSAGSASAASTSVDASFDVRPLLFPWKSLDGKQCGNHKTPYVSLVS